jgi:hypothetical protein
VTKVLLIDGPMRGQIYETDERSHVIRYLDYGAVSDYLRESVPVGTYWVRRYVLAGRVLLLGTVEYSAPELTDDVFWELLASDLAKQAVASVVPAVVPGAAR